MWEPGAGLIWMAGETRFYENPKNRFMRFRRTFALDFVPVRAELRIFADTHYLLFLDSRLLGRGPGRSDPTWTRYDRYDLKDELRKGLNTLAVLALFQGFGTGARISIMQGLLFHLVIEGAHGERMVVLGDRDWKASPAGEFLRPTPRLHGPLGCIEVQDLRLAEPEWTRPDFEDSSWPHADFIKPDLAVTPWYYFVANPVPRRAESEKEFLSEVILATVDFAPPPIDLLGTRRPVPVDAGASSLPARIEPASAAIVTLDLGAIENGFVRLDVEGSEGTIVDALFSDAIVGGIIPEPKQARILTSRWVLRDGRQTLEVAFNWLALRYVQLWIWSPAPVTIHRAWMRTLYYPLPEVDGFHCNLEPLTRLDAISTHTVKLCFQDAIVDGSSREQQQWMGDARKTAVFNHYRWGDRHLHRQLIEQIGQGMDWMGSMVPRYPSGNRNVSPIPSYSLDWICAFDDYHWFTGEDDLLATWWPNLLLAIRWFSAFQNASGLLEDVPHWLYIDLGKSPSGESMGTGRILATLNLQYLAALRCMAGYAERLSDRTASQWFITEAARVRCSLHAQLWNGRAYADAVSDGVLSPTISEVTSAHALLHLESPGSERARSILNEIFTEVSPAVRCSPFSMHLILEALRLHQEIPAAIRIVSERYAPLLAAKATATWEHWEILHWDGSQPVSDSACHAWGAAPMAFFTGTLLGIRPIEAGWKTIRIAPHPASLAWARGACLTPQGLIEVAWQCDECRFVMTIALSQAMEGEVVLPDGTRSPLRSGTYESALS